MLKKISLGGVCPQNKKSDPKFAHIGNEALWVAKDVDIFFCLRPPNFEKIRVKVFFSGAPPAKMGGRMKILAPWGPSSYGSLRSPKISDRYDPQRRRYKS